MTGFARRLRGLITFIGASLGLLVLVVGVPLGLSLGVGFPGSIPSWGDIVQQLQVQGIPTPFVLYTLAFVCWFLWAYLMWSLIAEAVAMARHSRAGGATIVRPGRRMAGPLIAALVVGLHLLVSAEHSPRVASTANPSLAPRSVAAALYSPDRFPVDPGRGGIVLTATGSSPPPPADQEVEVHPGDTLWGIAGREYQDPGDWPRIWAANEGRREEDGRVFTDPSLIYPGWGLEVPDGGRPPAAPSVGAPSSAASSQTSSSPAAGPPDAGTHTTPPAPTSPGDEEVEVLPGDTLWGIAASRMGDPLDWPQIWDLNQGHTEDDGRVFTDPSLIHAGWELEVPSASPPSMPPPTATSGSNGVVPASPSPPPTTAPSATSPAPTPAPSSGAAPTVPSSQSPATSRAGQSPVTQGESRPAAQQGEWLVTLAEGGLVGLSLAAAVLAALAAARRYERRRWRIGDRSQPRTRILARGPNLSRLRRAIAGWQAGHAGAAEDEQFRDMSELLAALPKPDDLPGTIPVGSRGDGGGDVVVDLDQLSGLCLAGRGGKAVARALAVSLLATHPDAWAELVVMDGFRGFELIPRLEGTPYVDTCGDIGSLLRRLDAELVRRRRDLSDREADDFRAAATGPDPLTATLVVLPSQALDLMRDPDRLDAVIRDGRRLGLGVVVVGTPTRMTPELRALVVDAEGTVGADHAHLIGGAHTLYHFSAAEAADLLRVFAAGSGPDMVPDVSPEEEAEVAPAAVVTSPETAALDGHPDGTGPEPTLTITGNPVETQRPRPVEITLFGGVRVFVHGQEVVEGIPGSGREVLALLVVKGRAVSKEEGIDAIGDGEVSDYFDRYWGAGVRKTRRTLRELLGDDAGNPIARRGDRYDLDRAIVDSDYWRLCSGTEAALLATDPQEKVRLLEEATRGIHGPPFLDSDFRWMNIEQEEIRRRGMETLENLADLRAQQGHFDGAIAALEQAMTLDPNPVEDIFRRMMVLQHQFGKGQAADETYRRLCRQLLKRLDAVPEPETEELIAIIRASSHRAAG